MGYFTAMQVNKLQLYSAIIEESQTILSERSKAQKNTYSMIHLSKVKNQAK